MYHSSSYFYISKATSSLYDRNLTQFCTLSKDLYTDYQTMKMTMTMTMMMMMMMMMISNQCNCSTRRHQGECQDQPRPAKLVQWWQCHLLCQHRESCFLQHRDIQVLTQLSCISHGLQLDTSTPSAPPKSFTRHTYQTVWTKRLQIVKKCTTDVHKIVLNQMVLDGSPLVSMPPPEAFCDRDL